MDKRYRIGDIYYSSEEFDIWRIHDTLMDIDCFLLCREEADIDELSYIAKAMDMGFDNEKLVILSLKEIDGRNAIIFSSANNSADTDGMIDMIKSGHASGYDLIGEISGADDEIPNALESGMLLNERYKILCCIGIGGFGITYLCEDIFLKRNVAIKEYFPEQWAERDETYVSVKHSGMLNAYRYGMESFMKEIRISAQFIHTANLITIYDAFMENDTVYMVMEYLHGISIGREMKKRNYKPYTSYEVAEIILPILEGLIQIHGKGIVHSDISPGNIIRSYTGYICLIDFGAAKYINESMPKLSSVFIKENYAAPEQYRTAVKKEASDEGAYTDIYAVGATMYYLLTGKKPKGAVERLSEERTEIPIPLRYRLNRKKKWLELINRCMEMDIEKRISSVEILYSEIKKMEKV